MQKIVSLQPWPLIHACRQGQSSHQVVDLHRGMGNTARLSPFLAVLLQGHRQPQHLQLGREHAVLEHRLRCPLPGL